MTDRLIVIPLGKVIFGYFIGKSLCGGFHQWGYPNSWMVYTGKSDEIGGYPQQVASKNTEKCPCS
jgi:hypothetical protein